MNSMNQIKNVVKENILFINSEISLTAISSGVLGQGIKPIKHILNVQVDKNYNHPNPKTHLKQICIKHGLEPNMTSGLLTAVLMKDLVILQDSIDEFWVKVFLTIGITNAAGAGSAYNHILKETKDQYSPGTINTIIITNGSLTNGALVNSVITATEAKSLALADTKVKDVINGSLASGTTSDAIVIATTNTGPNVEYAGTATNFGQLIGKLVRQGIKKGIKKGD
ncbi:adenosylcobinamide amidohydrolase [Candidatus Syntrophocurvum alkaliphilum]|nr:adenosylcobinamide amidohydrolase [Candidatus Syntrophocurvum alkaliphilum]